MSARQDTNTPETQIQESVHKPDWAALRLLNQYRLLILLAMAAIYYLGGNQSLLGSTHPSYFIAVHFAYLLTTLAFVYQHHLKRPAINIQFLVQNYLDVLFITTMMYVSGGLDSGLGPLLLINIALISQLCTIRYSLLFAAIASMCVMGEEILSSWANSNTSTNLEAAALLGALLFLTAWLTTVPLRRLLSRQLVSSTRSRAILDIRQIAQLNEEIVRELDSGVLVVDRHCNIQLMNDTARMLLAVEFVPMPSNLKKISAELFTNMDESEHSPTLQTRAFDIKSTGLTVLPHYTRLSNGGMLIRLDDHAHIRNQFQQLKLASLGRLSASIAHEIRNPLGAISHAVQLIEESSTLDVKDAELLKIARRHTQRINRIIEDVLQLSNRERVRFETLQVDEAINLFALRFREENSSNGAVLKIITEPCNAMADAGHLDQILWNLCTNARLHNSNEELQIIIHCYESGFGTLYIDVRDTGEGISDIDRDNLFEPFYSTHQTGTGLGLFIIRELCTLNNASIECMPTKLGAHFRVTLTSVQDMAA